MKLVRDKTGRFRQRPHYEPNELDFECENIITKFLRDRYGKVAFPISTDDLTVLIEQTTEDLDIYADLSSVGLDVEGVTYFAQDKKPFVKISKKLSETSNQNRLRTTLTHEYAHVKFHNFLWDEKIKEDKAVIAKNPDEGPICKREAIVNLKQVDWMEWQAGYISGALLMPLSVIKKLVSDFRERKNVIKIMKKILLVLFILSTIIIQGCACNINWSYNDFPLKVFLYGDMSSYEKESIDFALDLHNSQLGDVLEVVDNSSEADISIEFVDKLENISEEDDTIGYTDYSCSGPIKIYILRNTTKTWCTIAHELGHAMGHNFHDDNENSLMYPLNTGCGIYVPFGETGFLNYDFYKEFKDWFNSKYEKNI